MQGTEYLEQNKFKISAKNSGYFFINTTKKGVQTHSF